ncbi:hypothetical protein CEXT_483031 [Caerostris extrusa]|uniref:Uncharacterized protein n=1 Tax=Caerostris extrusa TaxID=172846 RepID=A0AAV4U809_CAEEX|nr:hypothetical protein CEXT_483031 [Caerostris extrusa]
MFIANIMAYQIYTGGSLATGRVCGWYQTKSGLPGWGVEYRTSEPILKSPRKLDGIFSTIEGTRSREEGLSPDSLIQWK